jgi:response regulator RpfG family c-di-GMP phosphodiesterase
MDKKTQMNFNLVNCLLATTDILDAKDIEQNTITKHHSLRVAYISLKMSEKLQYEPKEMFDLVSYGLFHNYINQSNTKLFKIDDSKQKISSIVELVNEIDAKCDFSNVTISNRTKIINHIELLPVENDIKKIFLEILYPLDFWLDCQSSSMMLQHIYSTLYDFTIVLTFEEVLEITAMFGNLYENVEEFLARCSSMCDYYDFEHKDKLTFLIAASMVNFGKLTISEKILTKKEKLSFEEFEHLKSNVYHNRNALRAIYGFDDISKWASRQYEQLNAKGYPSAIGANSLSLKDRLMSVLNIYNSLLSDKPYRRKFSHTEAIDILEEKAKNCEIDRAIVKDLDSNFRK